MTGIDLSYLELKEGEEPKLQDIKDTYFDEDGKDKEYKGGVQVPVFIELSRCTERILDAILDWSRQVHTTFVARYLGKLIVFFK